MRRLSSLERAVLRVIDEAPEMFATFYELFLEVAKTVLVPLLVIIFSPFLLIKLVRYIRRIIFPPDSVELRKEALGCLQRPGDKFSRSRAKRLLLQSIMKDPNYLPSHLSLAAMEIYVEQDSVSALDTLERAQKIFPNDKELIQLHLDAEAMSSNLGHMVTAGAFANKHLIFPRHESSDNSKTTQKRRLVNDSKDVLITKKMN